MYYGTDIVLDGEVCIVDFNGKEDWNKIVSEAKRKNYTIYNPKYICFDILTVQEFFGFKQSKDSDDDLGGICHGFWFYGRGSVCCFG